MKKQIKNTGKITAIYVRRSVSDKDKGNNSLSIDAQKEECIKFLEKGGKVSKSSYRIYCDDGKSGKDIAHRPAFQQMMSDAKDGLIDKIIVKKYDRFSRNMREYLNVTDQLDKYGVGVISLSEPFNTETKEGRMMRNNLLNFAEFERETIAARVADAFNTKARETGFYQGGKMYYGFNSERRTINGKTGSVLVPSERAEVVKIAYELYKEPSSSLKNVIDYFRENQIDTSSKAYRTHRETVVMDRTHLSKILKSPLYVRADKEVYKFYASKGVEMLDDVEAYDGVHGLFLHKNADGSEFIKLGYHEGLVDADTWLAVQDKKARNYKVPQNGNGTNSWLSGLVKCAHCGYAVHVYYGWNVSRTKQWRYYRDMGAYNAVGCKKYTLKLRPDNLEQIVFNAMCERFNSLTIAKQEREKSDAEAELLKSEIIRSEDEIRKLMDKLSEADEVLFDYIQKRIKELHEKKSDMENRLAARERKKKSVDTSPLSEPLAKWDELTVQEKHDVAVTMIDVIRVSDETGVDIQFSI